MLRFFVCCSCAFFLSVASVHAAVDYGNYTWRAWPNHQVENRLPTGPFAVVVGDKLVTGGGVDLYPNYPVFAENVHYFDLNTREWTKGGNLSVPCPVFGSVAVHNNTITLLSGYEMEYYYLVCRNRISEYDLLTHKFKQTGLRNDLPPLCSSSNIVVDNKLFMFGGDWIESTTTNSTNSTNITSLIAYDLVTKEFILNFSFAGDIPTNRIHSAIFRSPKPHKFRIFGGIEKDPSDGYWHYCSTSDIYEFDVETHVWTKIAQKQTRPQRVYLSSSQELPQDSAGHVLLTGGYRYSSSSNQTWKYDPSSNTWTRLNDLPIEREGPALVSWKDKLIVVGGYSNENTNSILAVYTEGPLSAPPPPSGKMVVDECAFQLWWDNPSDIRFMENYITYDINITRLSDGESQISQMAFSYYPQVRVNSSSLLISGQTYLASVRITPTAITSSPWSQEFEIQIPPNKSPKLDVLVTHSTYEFRCYGSNCASHSSSYDSEFSLLKDLSNTSICSGNCIYNDTGLCCTFDMYESTNLQTLRWTESKCSSAYSISVKYYDSSSSYYPDYHTLTFSCRFSGVIGVWEECPVFDAAPTMLPVSLLATFILCLFLSIVIRVI